MFVDLANEPADFYKNDNEQDEDAWAAATSTMCLM
jgi:hypothetical protein